MRRGFNAWREGAKFYVPLLVGGLLLCILSQGKVGVYVGVVATGLGLFTVYFFRDPGRKISAEEGDVVSPADGKVTAVEQLENTPYCDGACMRISIFLSVFNVHVNRTPYGGKVERIVYTNGAFMNAMKAESSEGNESNTIWLETEHGAMAVRQIAGLIARRIVCAVEEGETLAKGERFGMIRFGSRTELYLPVEAEACVKMGDTVHGGSTVVARLS